MMTRRPLTRIEWLGLVAVLLCVSWLGVDAIPRESATFDEQYHLTAGYSYLVTGDFRLANNHPPLMGMVGATGLLTKADVVLPLDDPAWQQGDRYRFSDLFLWESTDRALEYLVAARRQMIGVGLLLLLAIFFATRNLLGARAAWLALMLAAFDPNLLFHSRLVTTDLGVTTALFVATWQLWRWLHWQPSEAASARWTSLVLCGLFAGAAMAAKFTGLIFWPVAGVIVLATRGAPRYSLGRAVTALAAIFAIGQVVLWALYRFDIAPVQFGPVAMTIHAPYYWQNVWRTLVEITGDADRKLAFLLGARSYDGWWSYFPVALALKTPLPTLLCSTFGIFRLARRGEWRRSAAFWLMPAAFLALGMTGYLTIGYRHLLPAVPFLIVLAAYTAAPVARAQMAQRVGFTSYWRRILPWILVAWLAVTTLRIHPHQGEYFNELAGPWTRWHTLLVDSNLDWGQDLPALGQTMDALGIERVNLAYFGKAVPERYGVRYAPLPSFLRFMEGDELNAYNPRAPEPGWYAISATSLQLGLQQEENADLYAFFRARIPDARAGYSIYLYHVTYPDSTRVEQGVLVQQPVAAYVAAQPPLAGTRRQIRYLNDPASEIFPLGRGVDVATWAGFSALEADFGGSFTLLGLVTAPNVALPGETVDLDLVWRVGESAAPLPAPTRGRPLSAFVHLIRGADGKILAQYDGWPTALRGLQPGDVIRHRVALPLPADLAPGAYQLNIGLYSPQDGQRYPVSSAGQEADHVEARLEVGAR